MYWFLPILVLLQLYSSRAHADSSAEIPQRDHRGNRSEFVASLIKPGDVGAEIGVWSGSFAYHTLFQKQPAKLYLIDSWAGDAQSDPDRGDQSIGSQRARDNLYENVCKLFSPYPNVEVMRMKSEDAASHFPDRFFDYVYVDGDHSYDGVMLDLEKYWPKIKSGGLLIGDDYGWGNVSVAVTDFLQRHQGELIWLGNPLVEPREGQYVIKRKP